MAALAGVVVVVQFQLMSVEPMVVHTLVTPQLNYCNSLKVVLPLKFVQNSL